MLELKSFALALSKVEAAHERYRSHPLIISHILYISGRNRAILVLWLARYLHTPCQVEHPNFLSASTFLGKYTYIHSVVDQSDCSNSSNYRLIGLIYCFFKDFESVLDSKILNYLSKHNLLFWWTIRKVRFTVDLQGFLKLFLVIFNLRLRWNLSYFLKPIKSLRYSQTFSFQMIFLRIRYLSFYPHLKFPF